MDHLKSLIEKYSGPGPRYTSYPPVPFWVNAPDENQWIEQIKSSYSPTEGVDLYVHVPYCERLCYYCGCNRTITRDHELEYPFLQMVQAEWDLYRQKLGFIPKVNSLHFGGGTPTFLSPNNLQTLISRLTTNRTDSFIGSIEIDPRTCTADHLKVLSEMRISRVSLGIQDFDPVVQKAINRIQPQPMIEHLVQELRRLNFKSINFDLIYGLPRQNTSTVCDTMGIVAKLRPDLIAFYGYAHLPDRIKNQRLIEERDLPSTDLRRELYESGKAILNEYGYHDIGMDHFALTGSYLYQASMEKKLHRNFMGYVDKKTGILIGLGPTSISDSSKSFVQNAKDTKNYEQRIHSGTLAIETGHTHSQEDLLVQEMLLRLMCDGEVYFDQQKIPNWHEVRQELETFEQDGIINLTEGHLNLTARGKPFMRNVAMSFDYHLRQKNNKVKFSQTI